MKQKGNGYLVKFGRDIIKTLPKTKKSKSIEKLKSMNKPHRKMTRKSKHIKRKKDFIRNKIVNMYLTNWNRDKHRNRLKNFYNYIFTDKKKSEKYLHLFLKYLIPHKLLKLDKYEDDYNSFITHYRFNKDLWLKTTKNYYGEIEKDELIRKCHEMINFYKKYETNSKYIDFIDYNNNRLLENLDNKKNILNIFLSLLSFETQETAKSKNIIKFMQFLSEIDRIINFITSKNIYKTNEYYENLNYYNKPIIYNRFVFPFFLMFCDLAYFENEDIKKIIEGINHVFQKENMKQIMDFNVFCPDVIFKVLDCHPKIMLFHYEKNSETNLFIICRGTQNISELYADFTISRINTEFGQLHSGFYNTYNSRIKQNIIDYLEKIKVNCKNKINIFISGHSLGAALSVLIGCDIKDLIKSIMNDKEIGLVSMFNFSCPKIGSFNDRYCEERLIDLNFNIYNDPDPVCCFQDIGNVVGLKKYRENYFIDKMFTALTNYAIPEEFKKSSFPFPTSKIIALNIFNEDCNCNYSLPKKDFVQLLIYNKGYQTQFSYNINCLLNSKIKSNVKTLKDKIDAYHGHFRFENNGEHYSTMGIDFGYFSIKKMNMDKGEFDFINETIYRKIP